METDLKQLVPLIAGAALSLSGCGKQELALPADPIDRAATCGVVAAAEARTGTGDLAADLTIDQQGRILHHALLSGAEGDSFSQERVTQVVQRMPALEADITGGKWQPLVAECRTAYPATAITDVTLPSDPGEARTSCYVLGQFLAKALAGQANLYTEQLTAYGAMNRKLDDRIGAAFRRAGVAQGEAQQAARQQALGAAAKLGSPGAVMQSCLDRFA